jgi:hypothetical protein
MSGVAISSRVAVPRRIGSRSWQRSIASMVTRPTISTRSTRPGRTFAIDVVTQSTGNGRTMAAGELSSASAGTISLRSSKTWDRSQRPSTVSTGLTMTALIRQRTVGGLRSRNSFATDARSSRSRDPATLRDASCRTDRPGGRGARVLAARLPYRRVGHCARAAIGRIRRRAQLLDAPDPFRGGRFAVKRPWRVLA